MITVLVNGADCAARFNPSCSPAGLVANVRLTVSGSRRTVVDDVAPALSVTVRVRLMYDGYSWSGATNESLAVPVNPVMMCGWQSDGQCSRTMSQRICAAGI